MTIVVVSNKAQLDALRSMRPDLSGIKVICDSPAFYDILREKNISFTAIDEEDIRSKWPAIGVWACEKALLWGREAAEYGKFRNMEINKTLFVYFSHYLGVLLKSHMFARIIIDRYRPDEVLVFEDLWRPEPPLAHGNYFLNKLLSEYCKSRAIRVSVIKVPKVLSQNKPIVPVKEKIRRAVEYLYGYFKPSGTGRKIYLIHGSLRHLEGVIKQLKACGKETVIFDIKFNFEKARFCLKNNIIYLTPSYFLRKMGHASSFSAEYRDNFMNAVETIRKKRWFSYEDTDLSGFVCGELSDNTKKYFEDIKQWEFIYDSIARNFDVNALIVNDDWMPNSAFMAEFFRSRNIRVFCVSHGYGPIRFSVPENERKFYISETVVHSEYESSIYALRGWDRDHLHALGIPRYDRLSIYKKKKETVKRTGPMKILFVGSPMVGYSPDFTMYNFYPGVFQYIVGDNMRIWLKDVIDAAGDGNLQIMVKPHFDFDTPLWESLIAKTRKIDNISLRSSQSDFFDLLLECDAMISYWSTAVIEAMIVGVPVIIIDYAKSDVGHPLAKHELCRVVSDKDELAQAISCLYKLYSDNKKPVFPSAGIIDDIFYLGKNDQMNTRRTVEKIIAE